MRARKPPGIPLLKTLMLCLTATLVMAGPAHAPGSSGAVLAAETTPVPRERTTLDKVSSVAAVVSIGLVGAAGIYIYLRIRKGL